MLPERYRTDNDPREVRSLSRKLLHAVLITITGSACGALLGGLVGALAVGVGDEGSHGMWGVVMFGQIGFTIGSALGVAVAIISFLKR